MSYEATIHLFQSIQCKNLDQVKYALEEADIDGLNPHEGNVSPLYYAVRMQAYDIVDYLLENNAKTNLAVSSMQHDFTFAFAMQGSCDAIDHLISLHKKFKFDLTGKDKFQNDLIDISISRDSEKLFSYLCQNDVINTKHTDFQGENYLHAALRCDNPFFLQRLLNHPDAMHMVETDKTTPPLHICAEKYPQHLAEFLSYAKIDIEQRDAEGNTPLMIAIKAGNITSATQLLEAGANPDADDNAGERPLTITADKNFATLTTLLLDHGADCEAINKNQKSALTIAKEKEHDKVADLIANFQSAAKKETVQKAQETLKNSQISGKSITMRRRPK